MTTVDSPPDFGPDEPSYADMFPAPVPPSPEEIDSWLPINLNTIADEPPVEPNLVDVGVPIVYPGKRHVFSGLPESAKTLAAYALLIQVIRDGGDAVLIDFEMGKRDTLARLHELGATSADIDHLHYLEPNDPATPDRIQRLIDIGPRLVVIDAAAGAYDLEGYDDNKRQDVEKLARLYVGPFWRAGIATLFIDHVVKNAETRGRFVIGSERKLGGADVHLGFETITPISRDAKGLYKIITHKDRGGYLKRGHFANLELTSDTTGAITWAFKPVENETTDTGAFRPTHLMEKVSEHLEKQAEPVSRNSIIQEIKSNRNYVTAAIDALVLEDYADQTDGPRNAKLISSTRPYREANEPQTPPVSTSADLYRNMSDASCISDPLSRQGADTIPPPSTHVQNGRPVSADDDIPF